MSGDAEKGGSVIVRLGGWTMDKSEIARLLVLELVGAGVMSSSEGTGSLDLVPRWGTWAG